MTVSGGTLAVAIAIVAGATLVGVVLFLGHGAGAVVHRHWMGARRATARDDLLHLAAGAGDRLAHDRVVASLRRVGRRDRLALVLELLQSLSGAQAEALAAAAEEAGAAAGAARWCRSRRWRRRLRGVRAMTLMRRGGDVVPRCFDDAHREVRAAAAEWAGALPTTPRAAALVGLLDDPEQLVRLIAMDSLIRSGGLAIDPLVEAIGAGAGPQALEVAARIGAPGLVPAAVLRLSDPDPRVRLWVERLLGAVGGEDAVAGLLDGLGDQHPDVRAAAAIGLGRLGHWPAAARLSERLGDPAWIVRRDAALALRALGAPGELMLRRALRSDDGFAIDIARQTLDLPEVVLRA